MILPTKYTSPENSLLGIGNELLEIIYKTNQIENIFKQINKKRKIKITYQKFIFSLIMLYSLDLIKNNDKGDIYVKTKTLFDI